MKKFDSINVVPFIDIMLVLLAIVLTTSTFIAKGIIPVNLPKAKGESLKNLRQINITIKKNGILYFQKEVADKLSLEKRLRQIDTKTPIAIRCDKDAKFQLFVNVMQIVKELHFKNLAIITKE